LTPPVVQARLEELIEQREEIQLGVVRMRETVCVEKRLSPPLTKVVPDAAQRQREILMTVCDTGAPAIDKACDPDTARGCVLQNDIWQAKVTVAKDEILAGGNRRQELGEEIRRRTAGADRVEGILAHTTRSEAALGSGNLDRNPLIERTVCNICLMKKC
jgi:hypothetical protein